MVRRLLLLSLLAVSGVALTWGLRTAGPDVSVASCATLTAGEPRAACVEDVLLAADRSGSLTAAHDELLALVAADTSLHDDCHLALHRVGIAVVDDADEVPSLLIGLDSPLCSWGLGHGVFEGFGGLAASPAQWRAVSAVCEELSRTAATGALCGDGFGHALWDALHDPIGAMQGCGSLGEESIRIACAGGVLMQQLHPADGSRSPRRSLPAIEVLELCSEPTLLDRSWFLPGCLSGAGYVLVQQFVEERFATTGSLDEAAEGLGLAAAACRRFTVPGVASTQVEELCLGSLIGNLSARLRSPDGSFAGICAALREPSRCGV